MMSGRAREARGCWKILASLASDTPSNRSARGASLNPVHLLLTALAIEACACFSTPGIERLAPATVIAVVDREMILYRDIQRHPGYPWASSHFSLGGVTMAQEFFPQRVLVSEERSGHYGRGSMCALRGKG